MPTVSIITVNWNSGLQLQQALDSLQDIAGEVRLVEVWVVDNGSTDGSAANLNAHRLPLRLIRNTANLGFGAACNQAAEQATGDILLFLNPDTLQYPGALAAGVRGLSDPAIGAVGIRLADDSGTARTCCRPLTLGRLLVDSLKFDRLWPRLGFRMADFDHRTSRRVGHVMGAYYFVRRELFQHLGGFDERFFVYFEDYDLSIRVADAGYEILYDAQAAAFHRFGGTSQQIKARRLYYSMLSRLQLASKYFGVAGLIAAGLTMVLGELVLRLLRAVVAPRTSALGETLGGFGLLFTRGPADWRAARRRVAAQDTRQRSCRSVPAPVSAAA